MTENYMVCNCKQVSYSDIADAVQNNTKFDDVLKTFTKSQEYNGEAAIEYSLFVKVYETSKYFFLFSTHNNVYPVDKSTIEGGSAEDIRAKLSPLLGKKYILCKY